MSFEAIERAAEALHGARRVMINTGAGMSADSGISTYRDKEGRWKEFKPFTRLGLYPAEFSNPPGYRQRPQHAWAFAEYIRREMARAPLHQGYHVLTRWITERFEDAFVLTTNIDGLHRRASTPEIQLYERYGNIWELQCLERCTDHWWPDDRVEACLLDPETMEARRFPQCPFCHGLARPRIQMEHDPQFIGKDVGWQFYQNFLERGEIDVYLVIGTTLWLSWPESVEHAPTVIHINPNPETHARYDDPIALSLGAEDALTGIDWLLRQRDKV